MDDYLDIELDARLILDELWGRAEMYNAIGVNDVTVVIVVGVTVSVVNCSVGTVIVTGMLLLVLLLLCCLRRCHRYPSLPVLVSLPLLLNC